MEVQAEVDQYLRKHPSPPEPEFTEEDRKWWDDVAKKLDQTVSLGKVLFGRLVLHHYFPLNVLVLLMIMKNLERNEVDLWITCMYN